MEADSPINNNLFVLQQLKQGDHHAFNLIYQQYKTELGIRILRMVKSEMLTEELLQELFMRLWIQRGNIDPDKSIRAYLYQIAKNMVIDLLRRAAKEQHIQQQIIAATSELYEHVEQSLFKKENEAFLQQAIDQLPPQRKKIFVHCKIEGKSYKEVAEEYHISTTTVNDHIQKSMHSIKIFLTSRPGFQLYVLLAVLFSK
ncbi:RNA polymerase sigma factor [Pedobacter insulae]|uniref:RNA polymerase sigma-70 factor, ECF subfamily n=1 Tax=Pedobacter insulae TaxID=414048 RepID=A0A1I2ZIE5_9SPHI|nr:RNA polymerase sigma-70 factor [Pedobacter insulae]SFH37598.1 RNA polymerase sigma-70 factor, ECF subfamily [Pedobacter insulae]